MIPTFPSSPESWVLAPQGYVSKTMLRVFSWEPGNPRQGAYFRSRGGIGGHQLLAGGNQSLESGAETARSISLQWTTDPLCASTFSYVKLREYQLPPRAVRKIKWDNICKTQLPAWLGVKLSIWLVIIIVVVSAVSKCHSSEREWGCARDLEGAGS